MEYTPDSALLFHYRQTKSPIVEWSGEPWVGQKLQTYSN